jgi:CRP-like cAMP-binding protein
VRQGEVSETPLTIFAMLDLRLRVHLCLRLFVRLRLRLRLHTCACACVCVCAVHVFRPKVSLRPVLARMTWRAIRAGASISRQGTLAPFLAFVVEGAVDIHRKVTMTAPAAPISASEHVRTRRGSLSVGERPSTDSAAVTLVHSRLGQLTQGNYFGENCGLNVKLKGWDFNRPTSTPETFSLTAKTDVTLLVLTAESSMQLEPFFCLQFFLNTNPHGFNNMPQPQLIKSCIEEREHQAWINFKQNVLHSTNAGIGCVHTWV